MEEEFYFSRSIGYTLSGKVIESPKQMFDSKWFKAFNDAEGAAKSMARQYKIKWKPLPYGDRSKVG